MFVIFSRTTVLRNIFLSGQYQSSYLRVILKIHSENYVDLHESEHNVQTYFSKTHKYTVFNFFSDFLGLLREDKRQMDKHDEANGRILAIVCSHFYSQVFDEYSIYDQ
jgi:hypothetical protein